MNKASETKSRRKQVLSILGSGWKAGRGVEGSRDAYKKPGVIIMPQRTIDGNIYVGSEYGFKYVNSYEDALIVANDYLSKISRNKKK